MNKSFFLILSIFISTRAVAQTKEVCITVDDLPAVNYSSKGIGHLQLITDGLINTFVEHNIPAIGYVNEGKLYKNGQIDSAHIDLLDRWFRNGLELGNHTYSHSNYHKVSWEAYSKDIVKGEYVIKRLAKKYDRQVKYFRHPYLRVGLSKEAHEQLKDFLSTHNYIEAPVTVDNSDYLFAKAYHRAFAKNDSVTMKKIGADYIEHMLASLSYYEKLSMAIFDRPIKQTLLIHANLLNAHYIDEMVQMFKRNGYGFTSQEEVLKDSAYKTEISRYGNWGISWLERWAMTTDKVKDLFKSAPEIPEYINNMNQ